jgi:hypothetical protein
MFRLSQIIRNSFIRLQGFLSYRFRQFFAFLYQIFGFLRNLMGFTASPYFLEDEAQGIKQSETKQPVEAEPTKAPPAPATTRRRPDAKMDYYLKLAQPKKTSR